jgi:hypothetical protein
MDVYREGADSIGNNGDRVDGIMKLFGWSEPQMGETADMTYVCVE